MDHDGKRLEHGEDLNDALLDFFVKLGQALIPCGGLEGGFHSVAYLGSLFYDALCSRGVTDGREGHGNVTNWARRRLGQGGLFFDGIGALAIPVNESLADGKGGKEKHWWLALLLNPRAGGRDRQAGETMSMVYLDSYAHADLQCRPVIRVLKGGNLAGYPLEVSGIKRQGVFATVFFKARGDGSAGALPDPQKSILKAGDREFSNPRVELTTDIVGDDGRPGHCEGYLEFALDSHVKTGCEYSLEFGGRGVYGTFPKLCVKRGLSNFQHQVSRFVAGYVSKEWESSSDPSVLGRNSNTPYNASQIESEVRLPDVPQQETANDCGFFILEQILQALQLSPEAFRSLASSSEKMVSGLPWPSQKDVVWRKTRLKEALASLFKAAEEMGTADVEVLLKEDQELRSQLQSALWDGPRFADAARGLAVHSAPRQKFSIADLGVMSTKELRNLSAQHGVLQTGMVERADLLRALVPVVVAMAPSVKTPVVVKAMPAPEKAPTLAADINMPASPSPPASPAEVAAAQAAVAATASEAQGIAARLIGQGQKRPASEMHLSTLRFTVADLATLPLKTLRGLCVQHKVMPPCAMERGDFVQALMPLASAVHGGEPVSVEQCAAAASPTAEDTSNAPIDRKAKWQRVASSGEHLGSLQFSAEDIAVMPMKILKGLCVQYKVLPACAVERADFVNALQPFASATAKAL